MEKDLVLGIIIGAGGLGNILCLLKLYSIRLGAKIRVELKKK